MRLLTSIRFRRCGTSVAATRTILGFFLHALFRSRRGRNPGSGSATSNEARDTPFTDRVFASPSSRAHRRTLARRRLCARSMHRPREASYKIRSSRLHRRGQLHKQGRFGKAAQLPRAFQQQRLSRLCRDLCGIQRSGLRPCKAIHRPWRAVHGQSDPEGLEGIAVRITHLEAGLASDVQPSRKRLGLISGLGRSSGHSDFGNRTDRRSSAS